MTVRLSSRWTVAARPNFLKKQAPIFFCALHGLFSFGWGDSSGNSQTTDCILASRSYQQIQVLSPVSTSPVSFEQDMLNSLNMNLHHSTLSFSSLFVSEWGIHFAHCFLTCDAKTFLNLSGGNSWFGPDEFFCCLDVCDCGSICWCAALVLIIETLPALSKFIKQEKDLGSWWSILAKKNASNSQETSLDVSPSYSHRTSWI